MVDTLYSHYANPTFDDLVDFADYLFTHIDITAPHITEKYTVLELASAINEMLKSYKRYLQDIQMEKPDDNAGDKEFAGFSDEIISVASDAMPSVPRRRKRQKQK